MSLTVKRWSSRNDGLRSRSPVRVVKDRFGTPQSKGSVDAPRIPACPATSRTLAKMFCPSDWFRL